MSDEKKRTRFSVSAVSNKDFVKAYLTEDITSQDLAKQFDVSVASIQNRIATLKKAGVELPKLSRVSKTPAIDVNELNTLNSDNVHK